MTRKDGKPCKKCGTSEWFDSGHCKQCKRACNARWQKANPDYPRQWRAANLERVRANSKRWRAANPEKARESEKRYALNHPERRKETDRNRYEKDPAKRRAAVKRWERNNRSKLREYWQQRRAQERANGGNLTAKEWRQIRKRYGNRCLWCGRDDVPLTIDHVMPISQGGRNDAANVQPLCKSCNSRKRDRYMDFR